MTASRFTSSGVVAALSLAAFGYVTVEELPIGLLTLISAGLDASLPAVGLLVTVYALTVAVASVPLTRLLLRVPRRRLLVSLLAIQVVSTWIAAAAPNYWLLLVARLITALSQAVFWSVIAPTAAALFPPAVRGRVIALTFVGASLATVLGVPAGTWLGQQVGWRLAFVAVSGVGMLSLVTIAVLLPNTPPGQGHAATGTRPDARRYWTLILTTTLAVSGAFTAYTYVVPFLDEVSGFAPGVVSLLLLVFGVGGVMGTFASGAVVDRHPRALLLTAVGLLATALFGLYLLGPVRAATVVLLGLAGLALSAVPTTVQSRIMQVAPGSTEIASAYNSAAFNIGIGSGALIGGVLLPAYGVRSTALAGAVLAVAALAVLLTEPRVGTSGALSPARMDGLPTVP